MSIRGGGIRLLAVRATLGALAAILPAARAQTTLSAFVSSSLPPAERDYVAFQVSHLPQHLQDMLAASDPKQVHLTFIDGRTGAIHHNRPEDAGSITEADVTELPGDLRPGLRPPPTGGYDPGVTKNTGPYRRVYTTPLKAMPANYAKSGATYFTGAVVSIGCKAGTFTQDSDIGFTYLGGWSSDTTKPGSSVDAGLQYSDSKDNYAPFVAVSGSEDYTGVKGYVATGSRIPCNDSTPIVLEFDVYPALLTSDCKGTDPDCHSYALGLAVANTKGHLEQAVFWIVPNEGSSLGVDFGGWATLNDDGKNYWTETRCGGCLFKYMTSIGQKKPGDYKDGSSYHATWSSRYIACFALTCDDRGDPVAVTSAILDCSEYPLWYDKVYQHGNRDCTNTPKGTKGLGRSVKVSHHQATGETDTISLTH